MLFQIKLIISRIYHFELNSPISRFLTAFEILLTKCNDWETNAHSGVSLQQHLNNITQQIIVWRKLELNMWKNSLNHTFERFLIQLTHFFRFMRKSQLLYFPYRMNDPITKWWFYIYNAIEEFIKNDDATEKEFVTTIKQFMLQSNLAEYEKRLELLYTFHCHVIHLNRTKRTEIVINVLWNVHLYYNQFLTNVHDKIKDLRAPIEKKLKDYVKIVRWKDISYWAIKETLTKTHKTLHKHMREFEDVLKQSVLTHLSNVTSKSLESIGIWDRPKRQSPKSYHYTMDSSMYMAKQSHSKVSFRVSYKASFIFNIFFIDASRSTKREILQEIAKTMQKRDN